MKKTAFVIAAAAASLALCFTAWADCGSLVVLGDSIASGYGLEGYAAGDNYSTEYSFGSLLSEDCTEYANFAVDGRTSDELLTALGEEDISAALAEADSVVVSIGGNDFLRPMTYAIQREIINNPDLLGEITEEGSFEQVIDIMLGAAQSVDVSASGENIRAILGGIDEINPDCSVYLLTVYNPFEGIEGMESISEVAEEKLAELNGEIQAAAGEYGAGVADVYSAFSGHAADYTNITIMDIHPNKDGHAVIYELLMQLMGEPQAASAAAGGVSKGSPDTGAGSIAVFIGAAALGAAGMICFRKRNSTR